MSIEKDIKTRISTSYLLKFLSQKLLSIKFLFILTTLLLLTIAARSPVNDNLSYNITDTAIAVVNEELYPHLVRVRLQEDLISEVRNYIKKSAPTSKLDAKMLVELCQKYNVDITFVLAQAMLESSLGTKGKAAVTNSVWNVGTYDDGQIRHTYKTVNHSIEPFLILIKEKYLGEHKTIANLTRDGGYKTLKGGYRFATFTGYEARLRTMMININLNSSITMYQDVINLSDEKILAYFGPVNDSNTYDSSQYITYLQNK